MWSRLLARPRPTARDLIIAGDFADLDPAALAADAFASWRGSGDDLDDVVATVPVPPIGLSCCWSNWPERPQSTLRLAAPGITRADERWPAMFVANFAIGGNFSSRINTRAARAEGRHVRRQLVASTRRVATGLLAVSTAVRTDATAEALGRHRRRSCATRAARLTDDEVSDGRRARRPSRRRWGSNAPTRSSDGSSCCCRRGSRSTMSTPTSPASAPSRPRRPTRR